MVLKLISNNEFYSRSYFETKSVGLPQFPKVLGFVPKSDIARTLAESVVSRHMEYLPMTANASHQSTLFAVPTIKGFNTIRDAEIYFLRNIMDMTMIMELKHLEKAAKDLPKRITVVLHPYRKESQVWHTGSAHELVFDRHPRQDLGRYVENGILS
ncbi:hypothetical protein ElyMa_004497900 [Elysia marginata]|uniref:Uncharacterized protein n=1 Tax=Elysia marginata TaxID=1093978 RepID=A0AAV4HNE1_9GAST|nr:hypothetical protein ElyMa_004497900 [Elysia marginata]